MFFRQIFDEKLAQYAYLIGCQQTKEAVIIDPERDIDRYVKIAEAEGLRITAATETHIHADFLSGSRELAEQYGVKVYLSDEGDEDWKYRWTELGDYDVTLLEDGDSFRVGNIEIKAVHTPGHTPEHMSFLVIDHGGGADEPMGMASGDFVFVGDLGRPDLLETAAGHTGAMEPSARRLYRSAMELLELPDYLQMWPGHGAGSACGKALGAVPETTLGYERRFSPALAAAQKGENAFVEFILEGQPEPPPYFARMKRLNKEGVPLLGQLPHPPQRPAEDLRALANRSDIAVVDTRLERAAFFGGHLPGALYAPINKSFPTVVGSYVDPDQDVYLVVTEDHLDDAIRNLVRIGYDRIAGYFTPETLDRYHYDLGGELRSIPVIDFAEMERRRTARGQLVLDVRGAAEYGAGHVPGAVNVAHTRLALRLEEVPRDAPVMVHCQSGARSSAAVSLLERRGYDVVAVDDLWENWTPAAGAATEAVSPA